MHEWQIGICGDGVTLGAPRAQTCARGMMPLDPLLAKLLDWVYQTSFACCVGVTKVCGLLAASSVASFTQQRELPLLIVSSIFRKCGSRAVTALVGCGVKPRPRPLDKSQFAFPTKTVRLRKSPLDI